MKVGPIVGATTPLKLQDVLIGGNLATWGAGEALDYAADHPDWDRADALVHVNRARDVGSEVHDEIAALLKGEERPPAARDVGPYLWSWTAFVVERRPVFLEVERRIVNVKARYAGTLDALCTLDGNRRVALLDVKTGRERPSHVLQLAAYSMGKMASDEDLVIDRYHRYYYEEGAELTPLPRIRDYFILLLSPTGYELKEVEVTAADRRHYLRLVAAYHQIRAWENPE